MTGGIILAAGASTRMGRFKPMLPIGDTTFIKLMIRKMRAAGAETIIVVTGYRGSELKEHLLAEGVECVQNEHFDSTHMFDSMKLGLQNLPEGCNEVFLTPVDAVMTPAAVYRTLLASRADLVRPTFEGKGGHPVLIRRPLFDLLLGYRGQGGLRGVIKEFANRVEEIPVGTDLIRCDVDTPEDYRAILAQYDRETGDIGRVHLEIDMRLSTEDVLCSGSFFQLMELIDMLGSLQSAANVMHMSYTRAWKMVKHVEKHVSKPLISRWTGGEDGGGSELTDAGRDFLRRYTQLKTDLDRAADEILKKYFDGVRL